MSQVIRTSPFGERGRQFDTRIELSRVGIQLYNPDNMNKSRLYLRQKHGYVLGNLIWDILRVGGVADVFVESYRLSVDVKPSWGWNSRIDGLVEKAVNDLVGKPPRPTWPSVEIKTHPNGLMRSFGVDFEVSLTKIKIFNRGWPYNRDDLREIGQFGEELVRGLLKIAGVTGVYLDPDNFSVTIAPLFSWDEVQPRILNLLSEKVGTRVTVV